MSRYCTHPRLSFLQFPRTRWRRRELFRNGSFTTLTKMKIRSDIVKSEENMIPRKLWSMTMLFSFQVSRCFSYEIYAFCFTFLFHLILFYFLSLFFILDPKNHFFFLKINSLLLLSFSRYSTTEAYTIMNLFWKVQKLEEKSNSNRI